MTGLKVLIGSAVAITVGSFLPWSSVTSILGTTNIPGTVGDGVITAVLGVVLGVAAFVALNRREVSAPLGTMMLITAGVTAWVGIVDFRSVSEGTGLSDSSFVLASVGAGLYLVVGASVIGVLATLFVMSESSKSTG